MITPKTNSSRLDKIPLFPPLIKGETGGFRLSSVILIDFSDQILRPGRGDFLVNPNNLALSLYIG